MPSACENSNTKEMILGFFIKQKLHSLPIMTRCFGQGPILGVGSCPAIAFLRPSVACVWARLATQNWTLPKTMGDYAQEVQLLRNELVDYVALLAGGGFRVGGEAAEAGGADGEGAEAAVL